MTDKLEIAKLATELTVAVLSSAGDQAALARSLKLGASPTALGLFDAIYDHLLTKLTPQ